MTINEVTFNSVRFWTDLGAALASPVEYPIPAEIKDKVVIKGANGSLTESTGYFSDLIIKTDFKVLIGKGGAPGADKFNTLKRAINKTFNDISDNKLMFSDIPERCYIVKSCNVGAVTKTSDYEAKFKVEFTCDSFQYKPDEEPLPRVGTYDYGGDIPNKPVIEFTIESRGDAVLVCNDQELRFEVNTGLMQINANPYSIVTKDGVPVQSTGNAPIFRPGPNNIDIRGISYSNLKIYKKERYLG